MARTLISEIARSSPHASPQSVTTGRTIELDEALGGRRHVAIPEDAPDRVKEAAKDVATRIARMASRLETRTGNCAVDFAGTRHERPAVFTRPRFAIATKTGENTEVVDGRVSLPDGYRWMTVEEMRATGRW